MFNIRGRWVKGIWNPSVTLKLFQRLLAGSVEHTTLDLRVGRSSPMLGVDLTLRGGGGIYFFFN